MEKCIRIEHVLLLKAFSYEKKNKKKKQAVHNPVQTECTPPVVTDNYRWVITVETTVFQYVQPSPKR